VIPTVSVSQESGVVLKQGPAGAWQQQEWSRSGALHVRQEELGRYRRGGAAAALHPQSACAWIIGVALGRERLSEFAHGAQHQSGPHGVLGPPNRSHRPSASGYRLVTVLEKQQARFGGLFCVAWAFWDCAGTRRRHADKSPFRGARSAAASVPGSSRYVVARYADDGHIQSRKKRSR